MDVLGDQVYDTMFGLLDPAVDAGMARVMCGLAKVSLLRAFGCPCKMSIRDPEFRSVDPADRGSCPIHGD